MKRIAFVNQRYGKEVNGGSEYYTMLMAQKLKEHYEVDVLTTKALTYDKWEDYYKEDVENIDGVTVRRFGVKRNRNRYIQRILKTLIIHFGINTLKLSKAWNKVLGPYVPDLIEYIHENKDNYDTFIFVTYMYYPTVFGLPEVADKAILVSTAHDEYCIYFKLYKKLFHLPKRIVYLTPEEKDFVQKTFHNEVVPNEVIGVGIDIPAEVDADKFRKKYRISGDYLLYAGRVDADKGCDEMFTYFQKYCVINADLQLVVIGKSYMDIPKHKNIKYLGYVSEEDKYNAMKGAKLLWLPSKNESLSIAVLESMALGVPVIVNGKCEVLKGHCQRSGGGIWYNKYEDLKRITISMKDSEHNNLSIKAKSYINQYYQWSNIIACWNLLIEV